MHMAINAFKGDCKEKKVGSTIKRQRDGDGENVRNNDK